MHEQELQDIAEQAGKLAERIRQRDPSERERIDFQRAPVGDMRKPIKPAADPTLEQIEDALNLLAYNIRTYLQSR